MNNKTLLVVMFVILITLGGYLAMNKRKEDEETDEQKEEQIKATIKNIEAVPPIQEMNSLVNNPTVKTNYTLYQTDEGAGLEAIKEQMKRIVKNTGVMQDIRAKEKIGLNLFAGVPTKPAFVLRKWILEQNGGQDDTDILLIPNSIDDDFKRKILAAIDVLKNIGNFDKKNYASDEKKEAIERVRQLTNFVDSAGYGIFPDYETTLHGLIDNGNGYGNPKFPKEKKGRASNFNKYVPDAIKILENFLAASKKVDDSVKDYAVKKLRQAGWKFFGIDQPSN